MTAKRITVIAAATSPVGQSIYNVSPRAKCRYNAARKECTYSLTEQKFQALIRDLRNRGFNEFAVMRWF